MRVVSWNVGARVRRRAEQAERVASQDPHLVALQEVSRATLEPWCEAPAAMGLEHSLAAADWAGFPNGRRALSVLLAARWPLQALEQPPVPWPERVLAARVQAPAPLAACVLHSPVSQRPQLVKVPTHEAVWAYLRAASGSAWILCGDLNTPRRELRDGTVWTFARTSRGALRLERGERWDAAELALLRGLERFASAMSSAPCTATRTASRLGRGRAAPANCLDHLVASSQVSVTSCAYRHDWRTDGLSDHSGLVADLTVG